MTVRTANGDITISLVITLSDSLSGVVRLISLGNFSHCAVCGLQH